MGVIKKVLHRTECLTLPRHRNLFLDMEENIHIHYRDLRIELGRKEFEDICLTFSKQSSELLEIIDKKDYMDGELANANHEEERIWTESRLNNPVKYHPQRISLEECSDGYHFHYRNYKILIDEKDFRELQKIFENIDIDSPYASTSNEVIDLLTVNEIDYVLDRNDEKQQHVDISVAAYHHLKVKNILEGIGFESTNAPNVYKNQNITIKSKKDSSINHEQIKQLRGFSDVGLLCDFIAGGNISGDVINEIQCQFVDLYYGLKNKKIKNIQTDINLWMYSKRNRKLIIPYEGAEIKSDEVDSLYLSWRNLLKKHDLHFKKPAKQIFDADIQVNLSKKIQQNILQQAASFIAVKKIHVMGSFVRKSMGYYTVPFVHGKLVKLGSDVDILIEIDEQREHEIPDYWDFYVDEASNHCAIYHLGNVEFAGDSSDFENRYKNIPFLGHLLDAYVYFPSRGYAAETQAFLDKFKAVCMYDRDAGDRYYYSEKEKKIADEIVRKSALEEIFVEPVKVSTENEIYRVIADNKDLILKLFKVSGNYSSNRILEHVLYEKDLIRKFVSSGVKTPDVIDVIEERCEIKKYPALFFERLNAKVQQKPEYDIDMIAERLGELHTVQINSVFDLSQAFAYDDVCMMWLRQFEVYAKNLNDFESKIAVKISDLVSLVNQLNDGAFRSKMYEGSPHVHCHGDVTPKNVIGIDGDYQFFDFNNAFYGPRIVDVINGAIEFSLAEKYVHMADFSRFKEFIEHYEKYARFNDSEKEYFESWVMLVGVIMLTKELRVVSDKAFSRQHKLRRKRALLLADFLLGHRKDNQ
jgi:aminoglycoside phosphotransferase family enzyme